MGIWDYHHNRCSFIGLWEFHHHRLTSMGLWNYHHHRFSSMDLWNYQHHICSSMGLWNYHHYRFSSISLLDYHHGFSFMGLWDHHHHIFSTMGIWEFHHQILASIGLFNPWEVWFGVTDRISFSIALAFKAIIFQFSVQSPQPKFVHCIYSPKLFIAYTFSYIIDLLKQSYFYPQYIIQIFKFITSCTRTKNFVLLSSSL